MSNLKKAMEYRKLNRKLLALQRLAEQWDGKTITITIENLDTIDISNLALAIDDMAYNLELDFWDNYENNTAKDIKQLLNDNPDCNDIFVSVDEIFLK